MKKPTKQDVVDQIEAHIQALPILTGTEYAVKMGYIAGLLGMALRANLLDIGTYDRLCKKQIEGKNSCEKSP